MKCKSDTGRGCCFTRNQEAEAEAFALPSGSKLNSYDWASEIPDPMPKSDIYEIRFKNTRKGFYQNVNDLPLAVGDVVAVESSPGHDVGIVALTGDMVFKQMRRRGFNPNGVEFRKIYRKAKPYDIEKWQEAIAMEHETMIAARKIAADLGLNMKIGDVEYQGDKIKAIFYYIADERVDFRELIKLFAEQFKIRVEMKQIGARQEAGRIGGIGACGRELCCASWITSFASVTTNSARQQEISLNPQKLAGQCSKLKCCMNYEVDTYVDARRDFPRINQPLETLDGSYFLVKQDIFKRIMWFSSDPHSAVAIVPVPLERVREIIALNRKGKKADTLVVESTEEKVKELDFHNVVGEESITRFDTARSRRGGAERGGERSGDRGGDRDRRSGRNNRGRSQESRPQANNGPKSAETPNLNASPEKPQGADTPRPESRDRRNGRGRGPRQGGEGRAENRTERQPNPSSENAQQRQSTNNKPVTDQQGAEPRPNRNRNNRNRKPRNNDNGNGGRGEKPQDS